MLDSILPTPCDSCGEQVWFLGKDEAETNDDRTLCVDCAGDDKEDVVEEPELEETEDEEEDEQEEAEEAEDEEEDADGEDEDGEEDEE